LGERRRSVMTGLLEALGLMKPGEELPEQIA
jgi:hypothetical protein